MSATNGAASGHPLWHLLLLAGAATAVFIAIKGHETWQHHRRRPYVDGTDHADVRAPGKHIAPTPILTIIAVFSGATAALHARVTSEHLHEAFAYGVFFVACSCLQAAWGIVIVKQPRRSLVWAAIYGNVGIISVWIATRTTGLPFGPTPWRPEPVGLIDLACTLLEAAIVVGGIAAVTHDVRVTCAGTARRSTMPASVKTALGTAPTRTPDDRSHITTS